MEAYQSGPTGMSPEQAAASIAGLGAAPLIIPPIVNRGAFGGLEFTLGHKITTVVGTVDILPQASKPTKPKDQAVSFSTYGVVIPISMGKRVLSGNTVYSSPIHSRMLPLPYRYFIDYQIPITTTDERYGGLHPDNTQTQGLDLTETQKVVSTERVFQNNDTSSSNWVDVERYHKITLVNEQGVSRTYTFVVS